MTQQQKTNRNGRQPVGVRRGSSSQPQQQNSKRRRQSSASVEGAMQQDGSSKQQQVKINKLGSIVQGGHGHQVASLITSFLPVFQRKRASATSSRVLDVYKSKSTRQSTQKIDFSQQGQLRRIPDDFILYLPSMPSIRSLDFGDKLFSIQHLLQVLPRLEKLRVIRFSSINLSGQTNITPALTEALCNLQDLREISITHNDGVLPVIRMLGCLPKLEVLRGGKLLAGQSVVSTIQKLSAPYNIKVLEMQLGENSGLEHLLRATPYLQELSITKAHVPLGGLPPIMNALMAYTRLLSLNIQGMYHEHDEIDYNDATGDTVATYLSNSPQLRGLCLYYLSDYHSDDEQQNIAKALRHNTELRVLSLPSLDHNAAPALAHATLRMPHLLALLLDRSDELGAIVKFVPNPIRLVDLGNNNIRDDAGMSAMIDRLPRLTDLRGLSIGLDELHPVSDDSWKRLVDSLIPLRKLKYLVVKGNINTNQFAYLINVLVAHKKNVLEFFSFCNLTLSDPVLYELLLSLQDFPKLRGIDTLTKYDGNQQNIWTQSRINNIKRQQYLRRYFGERYDPHVEDISQGRIKSIVQDGSSTIL